LLKQHISPSYFNCLRFNQPFGRQKKGCGQYKATLRSFKNLVAFNAGGDHESLFAAYYNTHEGEFVLLLNK
jgi:hypothetical protein